MKRNLLIALAIVALATIGYTRLSGRINPSPTADNSKENPEPAANLATARVAKLSAKELFQKSAMVFIGTAKEDADICKGLEPPCTGIEFTSVNVVASKFDPPRRLQFALPEGPLPDGTSLKIAGAPEFIPGQAYLVFVRAGAWHLTPVTNWSYSYYRQVGLDRQRDQDSLFVDDQGRVVTGLDEHGFQVGARIAPPSTVLRTATTRGGGTSAVVNSSPPSIDEKVKATLAANDPKAMSQLGMSRESLVNTIAQYAKMFGLNQTDRVQLRPSRSGAYDVQQKPAQTEPGMEKAVYERPLPRSAIFERKGRDRDLETVGDPEKPQKSIPGPGAEANPRPTPAGRRQP